MSNPNWKKALDEDTEIFIKEVHTYHGCFTGDCPHEHQNDCYEEMLRHGAQLPNARLLKLIEALELYQHSPRIKMVKDTNGDNYHEENSWPALEALEELKKELGMK